MDLFWDMQKTQMMLASVCVTLFLVCLSTFLSPHLVFSLPLFPPAIHPLSFFFFSLSSPPPLFICVSVCLCVHPANNLSVICHLCISLTIPLRGKSRISLVSVGFINLFNPGFYLISPDIWECLLTWIDTFVCPLIHGFNIIVIVCLLSPMNPSVFCLSLYNVP